MEVVRSMDRVIAFIIFILFLFVGFGSMIYFYGQFSGKTKKKRVRKVKVACPLEGKRSSMRLRLKKHELVFIERITPD